EVKKYSEENFPAKFLILDEESKGSDRIIIHTILGGVLNNKTLLKRMTESQQSPPTQIEPEGQKQPPSIFTESAMDQLNQMLTMRDQMMNRLLSQGDKLAETRQEISEKAFQAQLESMQSMTNQKIETILELSKQRTELEVEKVKVTYQQGQQFWQELVMEGISVFKENPKIIIDAVDFIRELKAKPVGAE
ncbi:hypothetical protein P3G55_16650, partial [Leptospira sp. 96542]|nr:hypothetical protein [Leptospira sp. 96542]